MRIRNRPTRTACRRPAARDCSRTGPACRRARAGRGCRPGRSGRWSRRAWPGARAARDSSTARQPRPRVNRLQVGPNQLAARLVGILQRNGRAGMGVERGGPSAAASPASSARQMAPQEPFVLGRDPPAQVQAGQDQRRPTVGLPGSSARSLARGDGSPRPRRGLHSPTSARRCPAAA